MSIVNKTVVLYSSQNAVAGYVNFKNINGGCSVLVKHSGASRPLIFSINADGLGVKTFKINSSSESFVLPQQMQLGGQIFVSLISDDGQQIKTVAHGFLGAENTTSKIEQIEKDLELKSEELKTDKPLSNLHLDIKKEQVHEVQEKPTANNEQIVQEVNTAIKSFCNGAEDVNACARCKYRDAFYDGFDVSSLSSVQPQQERQEQNLFPQTFYQMVKPQLDQIFENNQACKALAEIIEQSKWASVGQMGQEGHYAVGLVYKAQQQVKYICYAVPSEKMEEPPKNLSEFCQWLPLDASQPEQSGYWVMYQNAIDGQSVKIN